jgi:hypothetical protein
MECLTRVLDVALQTFSGKWLTSRQKLSNLAEICFGGG